MIWIIIDVCGLNPLGPAPVDDTVGVGAELAVLAGFDHVDIVLAEVTCGMNPMKQ